MPNNHIARQTVDILAWKLDGIERDAAALRAEFRRWRELTSPEQPLEVHHSQVKRLTHRLEGLLDAVQSTISKPAEAPASSRVQHVREAVSGILSVRRIWEYFRGKLGQREQPRLAARLGVADDLAWSCYEPLQRAAKRTASNAAVDIKEPPLVYFNGGASPFAVARHRAFQPDDVDQEWENPLFGPILEDLPVPVLGLPWSLADRLPALMCLTHEVGHVAEEDFKLSDAVKRVIQDCVRDDPDSSRAAVWRAWRRELFADVFGAIAGGPSFTFALATYLLDDSARLRGETRSRDFPTDYPTAHLRMVMCRAVLRSLGHDASALESAWPLDLDRGHGLDDEWVTDAVTIARQLLDTKHAQLDNLSLHDLVAYTAFDHGAALGIGRLLREGKDPAPLATDVRQIVGAATLLYATDPATYSAHELDALLVERSRAARDPGARSGGFHPRDLARERDNAATLAEQDKRAGQRLLARLMNTGGKS